MKKLFIGVLFFALYNGDTTAQTDIVDANMAKDQESIVSIPGTYERIQPGTGRRYTLIVPEGYTGKTPVPLVMSLHYGGEVTPFYGHALLESLIEPGLRELGAIMVGPDCVSRGWANTEAGDHVLDLLDYI